MKVSLNKTALTLATTLLAFLAVAPKTVRSNFTVVRCISDVTELGPENVVGETFKVAVVIEDVANLCALDMKIRWNVDYFRFVSCIVTIPYERYPVPIPPSPYPGIFHGGFVPVPDPIINETTARISYVSMPAPPFSGDGTVAVFTFEVIDQPVQPQNGTFTVFFVHIGLADDLGSQIQYIAYNLEIPLFGTLPFNVRIADVSHPQIVCYGSFLLLEVNVTNEGSYTQTFNLTASLNETIKRTAQVIVEADTSRIIFYAWNTTGFNLDNYTVTAYAQLLTGDFNATDNSLTAGTVRIEVVGDVDGDFDVDILDVVRITRIYGVREGEPAYDPESDLDGDGAITILDVVTCTGHYGLRYP